MIAYIIRKMVTDKKETIGNTIFSSCLVAVMIVCCHIVEKVGEMMKNDWYKNSIEVASIGDPFIREKLGAIIKTILVMIGIVMCFCLVLYALKVKMDILKERQRISVFQVLGYTSLRRTGVLYIWKCTELFFAIGIGSGLSIGIWEILRNQRKFSKLMTLMSENMDYQWKFVLWIQLLLAVLVFAVSIRVVRNKGNLATVLKGEENE